MAIENFKHEDFNQFTNFCSNLCENLAYVDTGSLGKELILYENIELEH
jgi:hypothetical protein